MKNLKSVVFFKNMKKLSNKETIGSFRSIYNEFTDKFITLTQDLVDNMQQRFEYNLALNPDIKKKNVEDLSKGLNLLKESYVIYSWSLYERYQFQLAKVLLKNKSKKGNAFCQLIWSEIIKEKDNVFFEKLLHEENKANTSKSSVIIQNIDDISKQKCFGGNINSLLMKFVMSDSDIKISKFKDHQVLGLMKFRERRNLYVHRGSDLDDIYFDSLKKAVGKKPKLKEMVSNIKKKYNKSDKDDKEFLSEFKPRDVSDGINNIIFSFTEICNVLIESVDKNETLNYKNQSDSETRSVTLSLSNQLLILSQIYMKNCTILCKVFKKKYWNEYVYYRAAADMLSLSRYALLKGTKISDLSEEEKVNFGLTEILFFELFRHSSDKKINNMKFDLNKLFEHLNFKNKTFKQFLDGYFSDDIELLVMALEDHVLSFTKGKTEKKDCLRFAGIWFDEVNKTDWALLKKFEKNPKFKELIGKIT